MESRRVPSRSLEIGWTRQGTAWGFDSEKGMEAFAAAARDPNRKMTEWSKPGDTRGEMPKAASLIEGEYRGDYAYHAPMEPLNATASVTDGAAEIWCGTQSQTMAVEAVAKA